MGYLRKSSFSPLTAWTTISGPQKPENSLRNGVKFDARSVSRTIRRSFSFAENSFRKSSLSSSYLHFRWSGRNCVAGW